MLGVTNKPIMLSVVMLIVIMLSVVMLIVIMLSVVMLNVVTLVPVKKVQGLYSQHHFLFNLRMGPIS
jgi:hypothetical protein